MEIVSLITRLIWLSSFILIIYFAYYTIISLFSLKPIHSNPHSEPINRFAIIIPARNEAKVIGNLIQSLKRQNYPSHLFEIIVVTNNCTDNTKQVALENGGTVVECTDKVSSKGEVLSFIFREISNHEDSFDACCIFDADNLVEPDFLKEMNNAICAGGKVAQGYRDSKNPNDSYISACHSIYYYSVNRLYNHARSAIGLSAIVNGTGFMLCMDVLKQLEGWNTVTMTEDLEFSALCALNGFKIHWVPKAHFYDEQPITFAQSFTQRMRWSKGTMQCFGVYSGKLVKKAMEIKSVRPLDIIYLFVAPWIQILSFVSLIATLILTSYKIHYQLFPQTDLFFRMFISFDGSYMIPTFIAMMVVIMERKNVRKLIKGILTMWFFIISWIPINLICIVKSSVAWHPIEHTRNISIHELKTSINNEFEGI
ncbi:MAG: glycosyltransferase family 2 protein [Eubacteriales bacterium]